MHGLIFLTMHCLLTRKTMIVSRSVLIKSFPRPSNAPKVVTIHRSSRRTFFWGGKGGRNGADNRSSSHRWRNEHSSYFTSSSRDPGLEVTSVISDPKEVEAPIGLPSRAEQIRRLQNPTIKEDGAFDILVIGGGATGAGIAMDAAQRGLQTACIERGDFSSETSSRSTKLIWVRWTRCANATTLRISLLWV